MAKQTFTTGQVLTAAQMTSLQQTAMGGGSATAKTASYVLVAADAGTTVVMNAAGATTITVDASLFAAGDTVYIQNIGAGISTITAGTATVNTSADLALAQYEGGQLYFTSTSASIFLKGAGGGGAAAFVGCRLSKTSAQTISNATFTAVTYTAEDFDTNGFHDNSTNTSRITIPSGYDGYYEVFGICSFNQNGTGQRNFEVRKNGNLYNSFVMSAGSAAISAAVFSDVVSVVATDYIELFVYQSSGGNLNTTSNTGDPGSHVFGVTYLGA
jgi:hypothetical protein